LFSIKAGDTREGGAGVKDFGTGKNVRRTLLTFTVVNGRRRG
jgi:hypothetical protein